MATDEMEVAEQAHRAGTEAYMHFEVCQILKDWHLYAHKNTPFDAWRKT